ncbi:DUF3369 domain-containing protein [Aeromonas veronii]|uniref:DUF3369 domain-containing protein n=1 Tax=Aeromonas TaxID=642 RepID=UPI00084AD575|nr:MULTISPECIES: DUF3369 domain-containing protein [Aeromonas]MCF5863289.1 DUF3369 domain-containing protein [Aeromonas veronii]OEC48610.1 phosphodiesterase [Aeromonas sp. ANNP30]OEC60594.1 phosphodiesterase [Aeromonas sp. ANP5]
MSSAQDKDDILLDDDIIELDDEEVVVPKALNPWQVLIVDDEPDIHHATRLALSNIHYKSRPLELLNAYSGAEAGRMLEANPRIALILLDVVMETEDAGLRLVHRIRNEMHNSLVRIVLRTGQPGQAPEQRVILDYDINDYKTKTELTVQKLYTTVIASLRSYETLSAIDKSRQGLGKILEGAGDLYHLHSLKEFASGVLKQISAILDVGTEGAICAERRPGEQGLEILAATGDYETLLDDGKITDFPTLNDSVLKALAARSNRFEHPQDSLYIAAQNGREFVLSFTPTQPLDPLECDLLDVFCQRISAAYDNLYLYNQLLRAQEATVVALAALAEFRDSDTGEHVLRVQKLSDAIVAELKRMAAYPEQLTPEFVEMIGMASILHDVGKVGTPDHILHKPGRFDPEERAIMEQHAGIGANILHKAGEMVEGTSYLSLGAEIARGHHEHFDGKGYPQQLAGQQIPLSARIVAVVDVFDALLSKRPYKEPWTLAQTMEYIQSRSGTQFDPHVVTALSRLVNESRLPYSL